MSKMKFWIPDNSKRVAIEGNMLVPASQVDPNWWQVPVEPGRATKRIKLPDGNTITLNGGYYETADPVEVRALISDSTVRCMPEDAVVFGILPLEEVQKLGKLTSKAELDALAVKSGRPIEAIKEIPKNPETVAHEAAPRLPALPDFDTMSRDDLTDFAMGDQPDRVMQRMGDPIHVSSTWSRERMIEQIKKKLRERGDKRLS